MTDTYILKIFLYFWFLIRLNSEQELKKCKEKGFDWEELLVNRKGEYICMFIFFCFIMPPSLLGNGEVVRNIVKNF